MPKPQDRAGNRHVRGETRRVQFNIAQICDRWGEDSEVDVLPFDAVSNETLAWKLQEHRHMRRRWTAG
jgi:hypothetical protein